MIGLVWKLGEKYIFILFILIIKDLTYTFFVVDSRN